MRALRVLLTACRVPGTAALVRAYRENGERDICLIGCDASELAIGRRLCDRFHQVPPGDSPLFAVAALELCRRERVDAVLPQSFEDALALADARTEFAQDGISVLVSPAATVRTVGDGPSCYARLEEVGVRCPRWRLVRGGRELARAAAELGYPFEAVCVARRSKSPGVCVVDRAANPAERLFEERRDITELRLEELAAALPEVGGDQLLVMELADGPRRSIGGIAAAGELVLPIVQRPHRLGFEAMLFETLADNGLTDVARRIVAGMELDHFFDIELVGDLITSVSPCIPAMALQEDLNVPYLGLRSALGEIDTEELSSHAHRVRPTRRALRFTDQIEWDDGS